MSWLIRGLGAFFALIVVYLALMFGASESGEVVELITQDANGEQFTTRLWVADHDDAIWLRADSGSGWYHRLVQHDAQRHAVLCARRCDILDNKHLLSRDGQNPRHLDSK